MTLKGKPMNVKEFMTEDAVCCTPDATLQEAARLMRDNHVGAIPVVTSPEHKFLVGIITDRDLACRAVALNRHPNETLVRECMSSPVATVTPETAMETACKIMEADQIRRIPVVNSSRQLVGIVAQADIARVAPDFEIAELLKDISLPSDSASRVPLAA
jgi:CBS domain-containing protein